MEFRNFLVVLNVLTYAMFILTSLALPAANQVALLSRQSGRYVHVSESGIVFASSSKKSATVFVMYPINSAVQFEMKDNPGMFIMLERINLSSAEIASGGEVVPSSGLLNTTNSTESIEYALVVGNASENSLTRWEKGGSFDVLRQRLPDTNVNCFIAFDSTGNVAGPCGLDDVNDPKCIVTIEQLKPT